ncbi:MAG: 50S ribosomal protein L31e [Candidatus Aenigmarchaeota archaeon]|nr:50S ribosomal protein L31e [Candidatus Aenigmarchaeota archaeon]
MAEKEKKKEKKEKPVKKETLKPSAEKVFTIPLRKAFRKPKKKRAPYAVRIVRDFILRNLKTDDVKLGSHLNEAIWQRSIGKPPRRLHIGVNIKLIEGKKIAYAELLGHEYKERGWRASGQRPLKSRRLRGRLREKKKKNLKSRRKHSC